MLWLQESIGSRTELIEMPGFALVVGLGLERCLLACENKDSVAKLSIIAPLFEIFMRHGIQISELDSFLIVDALRTLQIIIYDVGGYLALNRYQRNHVRALFKRITLIMSRYSIPYGVLNEILELNAITQSWVGDMSSCVERVLHEIQEYKKRSTSSLW